MPREDKGTCFTCWRLETERNDARAQVEALRGALHRIAGMTYDVQYDNVSPAVARYASRIHHIARYAADPPQESSDAS